MTPDNTPQVFGDGNITICLTRDGFRVYVGQTEIHHLSKLQVVADAFGQPNQLSIGFQASTDQAIQNGIEENTRACAAISWIKVLR